MPEEKPSDNVERVLTDQKAVEERKQALIADLLRQKADAVKAFDDQLAKLGYQANSGKPQRSHHKKPAAAAGKTAEKAKPAATPGGDERQR
jgi:acyl-CoA reductase-like NAD-dependent aldehyde dehydrogenase